MFHNNTDHAIRHHTHEYHFRLLQCEKAVFDILGNEGFDTTLSEVHPRFQQLIQSIAHAHCSKLTYRHTAKGLLLLDLHYHFLFRIRIL